ncbi:thiamine-phosphate kinase [Acetobacteraceae bacterium]|nr:thiamine-phosphate kinase [Acetobacteraceae bacterium]
MNKTKSMKKNGEFSFIHRFFEPLAGKTAWKLGDDAAALPDLERGKEFVVSVDNLAENVHFFTDDPPQFVAQKLLRRNLSDMVAMGAKPTGYFLSLAFNPEKFEVEAWFKAFQEGLRLDQKIYDFSLLGGDTTVIKGDLFLSVTIVGEVEKEHLLHRKGAQVGDELWVTGTIGNAALGLAGREGRITALEAVFDKFYLLPQPPVGFLIGDLASSGMDVSDGLLQDAGHLSEASSVQVLLDISKIPLLPEAQKYFKDFSDLILSGGDDYQLLFTIAPEHVLEMKTRAAEHHIQVSRIGGIAEGGGVTLLNACGKEELYQQKGGWNHF